MPPLSDGIEFQQACRMFGSSPVQRLIHAKLAIERRSKLDRLIAERDISELPRLQGIVQGLNFALTVLHHSDTPDTVLDYAQTPFDLVGPG